MPNPQAAKEPFPWHLGVHDAHCHPVERMSSLKAIPTMKTRTLTIMGTRGDDQHLVDAAAREYGGSDINDPSNRVVPAFGWHPWFSHLIRDDTLEKDVSKADHYSLVLAPSPPPEFIDSLPDPTPLSKVLEDLRENLSSHPLALVGEIGLDRVFKLPSPWPSETLGEETNLRKESDDPERTPGARQGRRLSPYRVSMQHQVAIMKAQLLVAGDMARAVSVHGVQAHGLLHEAISSLWVGHERPTKKERKQGRVEDGKGRFPPRICLHSYSGSIGAIRPYFHRSVPVKVYVSLSTVNNFASSESASARAEEVVKWIPEDCILVESDLHAVGEEADEVLEDVTRRVCKIRGWALEEGVRKIGENWRAFVLGDR